MAKPTLTRRQRIALADAYAARGRKGLKRTRAGWEDPALDGALGHHSFMTVHSLVNRGLLELFVNGTCAHVTNAGADLHEQLREAAR